MKSTAGQAAPGLRGLRLHPAMSGGGYTCPQHFVMSNHTTIHSVCSCNSSDIFTRSGRSGPATLARPLRMVAKLCEIIASAPVAPSTYPGGRRSPGPPPTPRPGHRLCPLVWAQSRTWGYASKSKPLQSIQSVRWLPLRLAHTHFQTHYISLSLYALSFLTATYVCTCQQRIPIFKQYNLVLPGICAPGPVHLNFACCNLPTVRINTLLSTRNHRTWDQSRAPFLPRVLSSLVKHFLIVFISSKIFYQYADTCLLLL